MSDHYKRALKEQLTLIIAKHPRYRPGGASDPARGLDCSGYMFLAAKWAAVPGITRTTAARMALGWGGWHGEEIDLDEADECDLAFFTLAQNRPFGHVGALLRDAYGMPKVTHASSSRGVVLEDLHGNLLRNLVKVRRLSIGD